MLAGVKRAYGKPGVVKSLQRVSNVTSVTNMTTTTTNLHEIDSPDALLGDGLVDSDLIGSPVVGDTSARSDDATVRPRSHSQSSRRTSLEDSQNRVPRSTNELKADARLRLAKPRASRIDRTSSSLMFAISSATINLGANAVLTLGYFLYSHLADTSVLELGTNLPPASTSDCEPPSAEMIIVSRLAQYFSSIYLSVRRLFGKKLQDAVTSDFQRCELESLFRVEPLVKRADAGGPGLPRIGSLSTYYTQQALVRLLTLDVATKHVARDIDLSGYAIGGSLVCDASFVALNDGIVV